MDISYRCVIPQATSNFPKFAIVQEELRSLAANYHPMFVVKAFGLLSRNLKNMHLRNIVLATLLNCSLVQVQAQENTWKTLAKITFTKQYDEIMGFKVDVPVFSEDIQALEGNEIDIKGYIIPVEGYKGHKEFIFSAFPYSMCFFCGGAGPETVLD